MAHSCTCTLVDEPIKLNIIKPYRFVLRKSIINSWSFCLMSTLIIRCLPFVPLSCKTVVYLRYYSQYHVTRTFPPPRISTISCWAPAPARHTGRPRISTISCWAPAPARHTGRHHPCCSLPFPHQMSAWRRPSHRPSSPMLLFPLPTPDVSLTPRAASLSAAHQHHNH